MTILLITLKQFIQTTGKEWLHDIPIKLSELESKWNFRISLVMPELNYSLVALVKYKENDAILKMASSEQCLERESRCLA